jgi:hypothetical protein
MKYRTIKGGYRVPMFTKGWETSRFAIGLIFGLFSIWPTSFFYRKAFPNIPTVRRIALRYTWLGAAVNLILFALSFNV